MVGFPRPLTCEIDTSGEYHLLLPWTVAIQYGWRPTRRRNRFTLINGYRLTTRRGELHISWPGGPIIVPTRAYGPSTTSSPIWLNATTGPRRPYPGIDGYIGGQFFQQDERLIVDYTQGQQAIRVELP